MKPRPVDFFCVGAQKSGTTALHNYLNRHPDIFLPAIKETHFFNDGHAEFSLGLAHYLERYFSTKSDNQITGEIDPEYLYFPEVPGRIYQAFPMARLIIILREPVSRAYSHYWMTVRRGREKLSFADALAAESERLRNGSILEKSDYSYFARGLYYTQIMRYLEYFPIDQILFLRSEDLRVMPQEVLSKIYNFLKISNQPFEPISVRERHEAFMPISMRMQHILESDSTLKSVVRNSLPAVVHRHLKRPIQLLRHYNRRPFDSPKLDVTLFNEVSGRYSEDLMHLRRLTGITFMA